MTHLADRFYQSDQNERPRARIFRRPAIVAFYLTVVIGSAVYFLNAPINDSSNANATASDNASGPATENPIWKFARDLIIFHELPSSEVVLDLAPKGRLVSGRPAKAEVASPLDGELSAEAEVASPLDGELSAEDTSSYLGDSNPQLGEYDRDGLDQLIAEAQDWDAEIDFIVPKPVRVTRRTDKPLAVPTPRRAANPRRFERTTPNLALRQQTELVAFNASPFPFNGSAPGSTGRFLNAELSGQPAHRTHSGRVYSAAKTYSERRSLLHIPKGFDPDAPGVMVVFFHGHGAELSRDIWQRQKLPEQITRSGMNAVLVAPQFAVNARDSSIGNFWTPGALRDYLLEASEHLAEMLGRPDKVRAFDQLPVILVGYSGGYLPTAWGVAQGGINERLAGVVLMDALYGHTRTFSKWIKRSKSAFFVSAYARSTRRGNNRLMSLLEADDRLFKRYLGDQLEPGSVSFISAPVKHRSFVTEAWSSYPIADILRRVPGVARQNQLAQKRGPKVTTWAGIKNLFE